MHIDLAKIQGQVREVLKSIGALKPGAVAAEPPADPDALDQRLDGAAPTEAGLAEAGAEAAAGQGAPEDGGAPEGDGGEPDGDEGQDAGDEGEDGEGRPVKKALGEDDGADGFGNQDLTPDQVRALEKSYGNGTGHEEPTALLKGGEDLVEVLGSILRGMEDQQIILQALHDEITALKAGQTATNRKLSKAMADLQPEAHLEEPPVPVPTPKAVTRVAIKALDGGPAPAVRLTPDQIFAGMKGGTLSLEDATAAARQSRSV